MVGAAAFLDRDGVITNSLVRDGKPYAPMRPKDMEILTGAADAIDALNRAGYRVIVVTNQPDVGAAKVARSVVEAMHEKLLNELAIDDIRVCYHTDNDGCDCRKPKAGMLFDAARDWHIDLSRSVMVGDRWRDIDAGKAAGCRTIFIDHHYEENLRQLPDFTAQSLAEAAQIIVSQ